MKLNIDRKSDLVIAADIGGTNIRVALVDLSGDILNKTKVEYNPSLGIEKAGDLISEMIVRICDNQTIRGIGYSSAGPLNQVTGKYINPPNLTGWHNKSLIPTIKNNLGVTPRVGHDATLAALAETKFGEFSGSKDIVYLTVSTGVGAGMISNGNMIQGHNWFAGEVGHIIINPNGHSCSLGCPGCLEGNVSGTAIASIAKEKFFQNNSKILKDYSIEEINSKLVFEYALKGDILCKDILSSVIENLGRGLASLLAVLNPEVIILGGSVAQAISNNYWNELIKSISYYCIEFYKKSPPVKMTKLGEDASILGASIIGQN
jgi:glucokinase